MTKNMSRTTLNRAASEAMRSRLLDATVKALSTVSLSELRVAHVVDRAGVSRGTFYLHFKDREDILRATALAFLAGLDQVLKEAEASDVAYDQIEIVMGRYVEYVLERKDLARASYELSDRDPAVAAALLELLQTWAARTVRALRRLATLAASDDELGRRSFMLACMMEGVLKRTLNPLRPDIPGIDDASALVQDFSIIWRRAML